MTGCRKFIGLFIIIFIGIPVLFGIIWGVGMTKAVVSPEFLSDLPREIIAKIPTLLNETLEAVDQEGGIRDKEGRAWVRAMADVDVTPKELLEEIGIMSWLENELTHSLEDVGKILRGEIRPKPIMLDMRPLKKALTNPFLDQYLVKVLNQLPPCTESQQQEWLDAIMRGESRDDLPVCRPPDPAVAVKLLRIELNREIAEISDHYEILRTRGRFFLRDSGLDVARFVTSLTYLLFLIPLLFIGLGALIAATSKWGVIRWIGYSTLVGGGLAFLFSRLVMNLSRWGVGMGPIPFAEFDMDFPVVGEVFIEKGADLAMVVLNHLFSTVDSVSGVVCIVGIILIALSYFVTPSKPVARSAGAGSGGSGNPQPTPQPTPQTPTQTPPPAQPTPDPDPAAAPPVATFSGVTEHKTEPGVYYGELQQGEDDRAKQLNSKISKALNGEDSSNALKEGD